MKFHAWLLGLIGLVLSGIHPAQAQQMLLDRGGLNTLVRFEQRRPSLDNSNHTYSTEVLVRNVSGQALPGPLELSVKLLTPGVVFAGGANTTEASFPLIDEGKNLPVGGSFRPVPVTFRTLTPFKLIQFKVALSQPPVNPVDSALEAGALKLEGVEAGALNPVSAPLRFRIAGTQFLSDLKEVEIKVNGARVSTNKITATSQVIEASSVLTDGRNEIEFEAADVLGRPLYLRSTVWAGNYTLRVNLTGENGLPFLEAARIKLKLADDSSIITEAQTSNGTALLANVPFRTVLVEAKSNDNRYGIRGGVGNQGSIQVQLLGFKQPSDIDNNDFHLGIDGWNVGNSPHSLVSHIEDLAQSAASIRSLSEGTRLDRPRMQPFRQSAAASEFSQQALASADLDLSLSTDIEGPRSLSRTFQTKVGTSAVVIRYRFVTSEVPGGYFGSRYNDYFSVSLRSQLGGGNSSQANSMNGLGLGAFNYSSGSTAWRTVKLAVAPEGDTIQADVTVANVGDAAFDSQVVIDFVQEVRDQVKPTLSWNAQQGGLSLSYRVEEGELESATAINVFWANGEGYQNRLGAPVFTFTVPKGTPEGEYGPIAIAGNTLSNDPAGVTHLLAAASETSIFALPDVRVGYGPNANAAVVRAAMLDIIRDGLRAAGQAQATIGSTARTPEDQARVMWQNLYASTLTAITQRIASQRALYLPPGEAVIGVFEDAIEGLTVSQIAAKESEIRSAMLAEIYNQGPVNVSKHCADPTVINVVDVGRSAFNASNGPLFVNSVTPRLTSPPLVENAPNNAYHLQLQ